MVRILTICPSRNRPEKAHQFWASWADTVPWNGNNWFELVTEKDGECSEAYKKLFHFPTLFQTNIHWFEGESSYPNKINDATYAALPYFDIMGIGQDDLIFKTHNWHTKVAETLEGGGIAYPESGGYAKLPMMAFISSRIIYELGWVALPGLKHFFVDNVWVDLGEAANCLYFMPDVVVTHDHPNFGGTYDATYKHLYDTDMFAHDRGVYETWKRTRLAEDADKVRRALSSVG